MKSKLTLSIEKETIVKAKELARKRNSTVSQMIEDYIEQTDQIEKKLRAKERVSGIIESELAADADITHSKELNKKHGW